MKVKNEAVNETNKYSSLIFLVASQHLQMGRIYKAYIIGTEISG